jgi:chromosome segregation ATPase
VSNLHEKEPGVLLRAGEWDMLERARRGAPWPGEDMRTILVRLGHARAAMRDSEEMAWRDEYDELTRAFAVLLEDRDHARELLDEKREALRSMTRAKRKLEDDIEALEEEMRRYREERDAAKLAARDETARRLAAEKRAAP